MTFSTFGADERPRSPDFRPEDLAALLREQLSVVQTLLDAAERKREAILAREHEQIETIVAFQQRYVQRLQTLEDQRQGLSTSAVPRNEDAEAGGVVTLRDVLASVPPGKTKDELHAVATELNELLVRLDEKNRDNASLLYYSLSVVQTTLSALSGKEQRGTIYGPTAGAQGSGATADRGILDWRA